jgi:hypothetical protein
VSTPRRECRYFARSYPWSGGTSKAHHADLSPSHPCDPALCAAMVKPDRTNSPCASRPRIHSSDKVQWLSTGTYLRRPPCALRINVSLDAVRTSLVGRRMDSQRCIRTHRPSGPRYRTLGLPMVGPYPASRCLPLMIGTAAEQPGRDTTWGTFTSSVRAPSGSPRQPASSLGRIAFKPETMRPRSRAAGGPQNHRPQRTTASLEVATLPQAKRGFVPLPRRGVDERDVEWLSQVRHLARAQERLADVKDSDLAALTVQ